MDRIEFNKKKTPIPVSTGTDYSRFINIRKSADLSGDNSGPYSSLFDYKQEEADLAAQNNKKQAVQQKIMRTNALGDAFRLIAEGIGATAGATITPRNVNPGILSAVNEYGKNDTEYMQRLQGINTKKLALKQADLQYSLGQDAAALDKAEKQAERTHQEGLQAEKEVNDFIQTQSNLKETYRLRGEENKANDARKLEMMGLDLSNTLQVAKAKAQFDRGWGLQGEGQPQFDLSTPSKSSAKNPKIPFIVPDIPTKTVQLPPELIDEIRFQLIGPDGNKYDPAVPEALRAVLKNKKPEQASLMQAIRENWNAGANIKGRMKDFAPSAYEQIYGQIGNETTTQSQPSTPGVPKGVTQPDGTIVLDDSSREELQKKLLDSLNDTTLDLGKDKQVNKKISELSDMIFNDHKAIGSKMTHNEAVTEANNIMSKFRQKKRQATSSSK